MTTSDTATSATISAVIFLSALYTFTIIARLPPGWLRLLGSLPVFAINLYLPHAVDATQNAMMSIILTSFFGWWANFKVLALCWGGGPLQSLLSPSAPRQQPPSLLSFFLFASVYTLPLVFKGFGQDGKKGAKEPKAYQSGKASSVEALQVGPSGGVALVHRTSNRGGTSEPHKNSQMAQSEVKEDNGKVFPSQSGVYEPGHVGLPERATWQSLSGQSLSSLIIFLLCLYLLDFRPWLPHVVVTALYCLLLYTSMLYMFNAAAAAMEGLGGVEVCEHFRRPYLASSLQDFWGHRWNLVAGQLLKEAVYLPAKKLLQPHRPLHTPLSVLLTFFVSGIMHEMVIFNATGHINGLTCEWLIFFTLHGVLVLAEISIKKKWRSLGWKEFSPLASIPLTLFILVTTAELFFFPPVARHGLDIRAVGEHRRLLPGDLVYKYFGIEDPGSYYH